ncbi:MAG: aryl-alcohol dehydrogenase-like predicted oxidoreductase/histidinol phosphatase-like enzyme [Cognaticolwellia sp.]|jgi:aryl-alcohol dehydrogenase-like predicted oxidoreductase/histidinol phosphatase-like enzyme
MALTPSAQALAHAAVHQALQNAKASWIEKIQRIQNAFSPPLRNSELSAGMGLEVPPPGVARASTVGRWVSTSKRLLSALPDPGEAALLEQILAGELHLALRPGGQRRELLLCTDTDLPRLGSAWILLNLGGKPLPESSDWEQGWDLFSSAQPAASAQAEHPLTVSHPGRTLRKTLPFAPPLPLPGLVLGCMRLSTEGAHSEDQAVALIQAAAQAGVTLFDSADVYATSEDTLHHNHRLLARALEDFPQAQVLTKVGLARPKGRWMPDGRPERLLTQARRAQETLEVERIALLQLHVVDRRVPFEESLDALAQLVGEGTVARIGLCNVSVEQLTQACARIPVASVQVGWSPFEPKAGRSGAVVQAAFERGIPVLAHSPLGGHKRRGKALPVPFQALAKALGVSPQRVAVAWMLTLGHSPIVGVTRPESLQDSLAAVALAQELAQDPRLLKLLPDQQRGGQVRIVMGPPASGKTQHVAPLERAGWGRFNRDTLGGTLKGVDKELKEALQGGLRYAVLDNTYPSVASRAGVIAAAQAQGLPVVCQWIQCTERDAQINACQRMIQRQGRILSPAEVKQASKSDPNMLPPAAIGHWFNTFAEPTTEEGITVLQPLPFKRTPAGSKGALFFDYDGTLRRSTGRAPFPFYPNQVQIMKGRKKVMRGLKDAGWLLLGVSNQGAIEQGSLKPERAQACFDQTHVLLDVELDLLFSSWVDRQAWDRKPNPGMGVAHMVKHGLDLSICLMVGDRDSDRRFAENLGMAYADAEVFFADHKPFLPGETGKKG